MMRAHAQDLRQELEGSITMKRTFVTTHGQSGQNDSIERSSLLHRLRNDKQLQDQVSRTMNSLGMVEGDTDSDQDEELQEQA